MTGRDDTLYHIAQVESSAIAPATDGAKKQPWRRDGRMMGRPAPDGAGAPMYRPAFAQHHRMPLAKYMPATLVIYYIMKMADITMDRLPVSVPSAYRRDPLPAPGSPGVVIERMDASAAVAVDSEDPGRLAAILDPVVALAAWRRPVPVGLSTADLSGFEAIRLESDRGAIAAGLRTALAGQPAADWHAPVADDAGVLGERFAAIMGCDRMVVRLEPVSTNACKKFHTDHVTVRLLTTYLGQGTQWIVGDEDDAAVRQMAAGHVALFKGRRWAPDTRVLHRSPPIDGTGEVRLLLVIDPIEGAADAV